MLNISRRFPHPSAEVVRTADEHLWRSSAQVGRTIFRCTYRLSTAIVKQYVYKLPLDVAFFIAKRWFIWLSEQVFENSVNPILKFIKIHEFYV